MAVKHFTLIGINSKTPATTGMMVAGVFLQCVTDR